MDLKKFAKYTERIRTMLPFWFKIKKHPRETLGIDFLNVFGLQLDDIEKVLDYAQRQYYIDTADEHFVDIVYKVLLPSHYDTDEISMVYTDTKSLDRVFSLFDFFQLEKNIYDIYNEKPSTDFYILDTTNKIIYVREPFDKDNENTNGKINISYKGNKKVFPLQLHHVWNFFDEFGALVGCKRLYGEKNHSYKQRILDVFKNPANSTRYGLVNGIARELNLRHIEQWKNLAEDYVIEHRMVIVNTIKINDEYVPVENVKVNNKGALVLLGDKEKEGQSAEVSFICGMEMTKLLNAYDETKLNTELFNDDGTITELLNKYIQEIGKDASILWNDFKYDEAFWIDETEDYYEKQYGFKPTLMDANIKGFASYGYRKL